MCRILPWMTPIRSSCAIIVDSWVIRLDAHWNLHFKFRSGLPSDETAAPRNDCLKLAFADDAPRYYRPGAFGHCSRRLGFCRRVPSVFGARRALESRLKYQKLLTNLTGAAEMHFLCYIVAYSKLEVRAEASAPAAPPVSGERAGKRLSVLGFTKDSATGKTGCCRMLASKPHDMQASSARLITHFHSHFASHLATARSLLCPDTNALAYLCFMRILCFMWPTGNVCCVVSFTQV